MGDPKKLKKKYSPPIHPWKKEAIDSEKKIKKEYGLKNKQEIYRASSFLKKYKDLAKKLIAKQDSAQKEKEKQQILSKLQNLGLLSNAAKLDDILGLQLNDILQRRLQSLVVKKNLARTMKQSRQFITHRHIKVKDTELTSPSYLVSTQEESAIAFKPNSTLNQEDHPERVVSAVTEKKENLEKPKEKKERKNKPAEEAKRKEKPILEKSIEKAELDKDKKEE